MLIHSKPGSGMRRAVTTPAHIPPDGARERKRTQMSMKRVVATRVFCALLMSQVLGVTSAFAQSTAPATSDACTTRAPFGRYCVTPAQDAAKAISQLFTLESNPQVDNPIEFAALYRELYSQFINTQIGNLSQGSSLAAF